MEPVAILFGACFTVAAATSLGTLLLGSSCREYPVRFVCGAGILSLAVFVLCCLGLAYPLVFLGTGGLALLAMLRSSRPTPLPWKNSTRIKSILLVVFAAYFIIYLMNAMAPEVSPDGSSYHLSLVARYLRDHGFHPITWNLYASLSEGLEMLFLFAFAFGRHSAAAMVHFAFLLALAWEIYGYGKRVGFPLAGACAAALVFVSPVVGIDGVSAYNDAALAAIAFTLFYLLQLWSNSRNPRLLAAIGILAGFSYGVKYTAWTAVAYALAFVFWKSRRLRDVGVVSGCAMLLIAPWVIKDWLWVGNPLAPFLNQYFSNQFVTIAFENDLAKYFRHYSLSSLWQIPFAATVSGRLQGVLGPVFLLAPLALVALRWRAGRQLLLAALVFGANYFSNIGARFLIPPLPFVALAISMVLASIPGLALAVVVLHAALSWPSVVPRYAMGGALHLTKVPWREALRIRDTGHFMRTHLPGGYAVVQLIEERTPPGATVFSFRGLPDAYTSRRVLVEYDSAGNQMLGRILEGAFMPGLMPTWRLRFGFPRQHWRALRVVQTASGRDIWSIHELRVLDGQRELARDPRWRLTASPFPWTIQEAFDNSPLTLWRSGEAIHPGMFVQVNFGAAQEADEVLIETSSDQNEIRLKLEALDEVGNWRMMARAPAIFDAAPPLGLRRAAARELGRRGVGFIVSFDDMPDSGDFRANQDLWGIRQVGEAEGARLYQLP